MIKKIVIKENYSDTNVYKYDSLGKLVQRVNGNNVYLYNSFEKMEKRYYNQKNGEKLIVQLNNYTNKGDLTESYILDEKSNMLIIDNRYVYDSVGNVIEATENRLHKESILAKYTCKYDKRGRLIEKIDFPYASKDEHMSSIGKEFNKLHSAKFPITQTFAYDDNGNVIEQVFTDKTGEVKIVIKRTFTK